MQFAQKGETALDDNAESRTNHKTHYARLAEFLSKRRLSSDPLKAFG
jgi:hypothetical protein